MLEPASLAMLKAIEIAAVLEAVPLAMLKAIEIAVLDAMLEAVEIAVLNAMLEAVCARTSFTCNAQSNRNCSA